MPCIVLVKAERGVLNPGNSTSDNRYRNFELFIAGSLTGCYEEPGNEAFNHVEWNANQISWYCGDPYYRQVSHESVQFNALNKTYHWVAIT